MNRVLNVKPIWLLDKRAYGWAWFCILDAFSCDSCLLWAYFLAKFSKMGAHIFQPWLGFSSVSNYSISTAPPPLTYSHIISNLLPFFLVRIIKIKNACTIRKFVCFWILLFRNIHHFAACFFTTWKLFSPCEMSDIVIVYTFVAISFSLSVMCRISREPRQCEREYMCGVVVAQSYRNRLHHLDLSNI